MDTSLIKQAQAQGLVCVTLDIHLWSGRKRLRKEALLAKNPEFSNLPPESLATLGSIKISDPEDLAPFAGLKRDAERVLHTTGLPLLGTIGIPQARLERVYQQLTELRARFDQQRTRLHWEFEGRVREWRERPENAAWAHLIDDIPTPEYVAGRLAFNFHFCRISAPSADTDSPLNEGYGSQLGGLKGELFAEAAREARVLLERYLAGGPAGNALDRQKISHKTLGPLRRIAEKLRSFSFLDASVQPMAEVVEHCLALLPKQGPIDGVHLVHIWSLARTLANEKAAEEAAVIALQLSSPRAAFQDLLNKAAATSQPPVEQGVDPASNRDAEPASEEFLAADAIDRAAAQPPRPVEFTPQLAGVFF